MEISGGMWAGTPNSSLGITSASAAPQRSWGQLGSAGVSWGLLGSAGVFVDFCVFCAADVSCCWPVTLLSASVCLSVSLSVYLFACLVSLPVCLASLYLSAWWICRGPHVQVCQGPASFITGRSGRWLARGPFEKEDARLYLPFLIR